MELITFFKKHCLVCGAAIPDKRQLCHACVVKLPLLDRALVCGCCSAKLEVEGMRCGTCLQQSPHFTETYALWAYDAHTSHLIQRLKFYEDFSVLPFLVSSLSEGLQQHYQHRNFPEVIIPVPIHARRLFRRGFNQADQLAKGLAKSLKIPMQNQLIRKVKSTRAQASLHLEDRSKNLHAAFKVTKPLAFHTVALLDDVMTTGSTVNEIARILKAVGVGEVHVWVLARAMKVR